MLLTSSSLASVLGACDGYRRLLSRASVAPLAKPKDSAERLQKQFLLAFEWSWELLGTSKTLDLLRFQDTSWRSLRSVLERPEASSDGFSEAVWVPFAHFDEGT